MKKLKIYLDTSIISFYYADDSPEYKNITIQFFENCHYYETYVSDIVLYEINKTPDPDLKQKFLDLILEYELKELIFNEEKIQEIDFLSGKYIGTGIIPEKKIEDAYHIASATVCEIDVLLSWNFKHIANLNKSIKINAVNRECNYLKELKILTPMEVIYYE